MITFTFVKRNITILSIMIAALFAAQHPFSQFLAKSMHPLSASLVSYGVSGAFYIVYNLYSSKSRHDFVLICRTRRDLIHALVICAAALGSLLTYLAALNFNKNLVIAIILFNTSPIWGALWDYLFKRHKPPPGFSFYFLIAFVGVVVSLLGPVLFGSASITGVGWAWLWAIPVPLFFTLAVTLTQFWLAPPYDNGAAVTASTFFGAALYIMGLVILNQVGVIDNGIFFIGDKVVEAGWLAVLMFIVGTLAQTFAGRILLQYTLRLPGATFSYVSSFWLLIPSMSALIILVIGTLREDASALPNKYQIVGIFFVAFGLYLNHRARAKASKHA